MALAGCLQPAFPTDQSCYGFLHSGLRSAQNHACLTASIQECPRKELFHSDQNWVFLFNNPAHQNTGRQTCKGLDYVTVYYSAVKEE